MEHWKPIAGYDGYEVSSLGRVRSMKHKKVKILKPGNAGYGYLAVNLCKNGKVKYMKVHRLVAEAFIPNPQNLETVNHIDEDKTNNNVNNLEWMTQADNNRYGTRIARCSKQVQMFDKSTGELLATFPSIKEAELQTGISSGNICSCCNGNRDKSAGGFVWKYA